MTAQLVTAFGIRRHGEGLGLEFRTPVAWSHRLMSEIVQSLGKSQMIRRSGSDPFDREHPFGLALPKKFAPKFRTTGEWQRLIWNIDVCDLDHRCRKSKDVSDFDLATARLNENTIGIGCWIFRLRGPSDPGNEPEQNQKCALHS